jgi:hypothetical protein
MKVVVTGLLLALCVSAAYGWTWSTWANGDCSGTAALEYDCKADACCKPKNGAGSIKAKCDDYNLKGEAYASTDCSGTGVAITGTFGKSNSDKCVKASSVSSKFTCSPASSVQVLSFGVLALIAMIGMML